MYHCFGLKCDLCREVLEAEKKGCTVEMKLAKITNEVANFPMREPPNLTFENKGESGIQSWGDV